VKILLRTDASADIGTGHVMRCSTLAEELQAQGACIYFACRLLPDNLKSMLLAKGFSVYLLDNIPEKTESNTYVLPHSHWLDISQTEDASATLSAIKNDTFDWIIVDHYALDKSWEEVMRPVAKRIMVIDDLADREHACDLLFDQNFYLDQHNRYNRLIPKDCRMLVGPEYALLRNEFKVCRRQAGIRTGNVKSILVFFGGVDQFDFTSKAVLALSNMRDTALTVDVVIGAQHPAREALISSCATFGFNLHIQTSHMAELMLKADLSIGAGGGAVWERACLKLPTISIAIAEHQITQLKDLSQTGMVYSFDSHDVTSLQIQKHVEALIENQALRHLLSVNSAALVDGAGAIKVARVLLTATQLDMRLATIADEKDLYEWRNHPKIREVSFNEQVITLEQHTQWFRNTLSNPNRLLLIGEMKENPVGVVRFDIDGNSAEVSIYLIQENHHKGLGQSLLSSAEQWLKENKTNISVIKANVIERNSISQRFFTHAGYEPVSRSYEKVL
jgi:UDP-2,4-diacetamido-2,4,6-trideoxy-beta-L-altropyranose hydrolase